ncbi:hypothetical protein AMTRI_Chr09g31560 [Amborella trichopoda]
MVQASGHLAICYAKPPSTANLHFLSESVPEFLATLVLPHSIITQDPFAILHLLPQFTALVLLGYSYVGKRLAKCSADSFPKLQILHRRWRIGVSFRLLAFPMNEDELQSTFVMNDQTSFRAGWLHLIHQILKSPLI